MIPVIPAEMLSGAVELAVYFVTVLAVWLNFVMTARA